MPTARSFSAWPAESSAQPRAAATSAAVTRKHRSEADTTPRSSMAATKLSTASRRPSSRSGADALRGALRASAVGGEARRATVELLAARRLTSMYAVSYTHLTLPTICSV
eukprot:2915306-Prymnesium_polylepis.1